MTLCNRCGSYFGAINAKNSHEKECQHANSSSTRPQVAHAAQEDLVTRVRPSRIKARRGVELLCLMENNDLEWYDLDDVDDDVNLSEAPFQSVRHGTPVIPIEQRKPVWMDVDNEDL